MSSIRHLLVALAATTGAVGCTHCDTCDDFPSPCNGPNCGYQAFPTTNEIPVGPIYTSPAPISDPPVLNSQMASPPGPSTSGSPFADEPTSPPNELPSNSPDSPPSIPGFDIEPAPLP